MMTLEVRDIITLSSPRMTSHEFKRRRGGCSVTTVQMPLSIILLGIKQDPDNANGGIAMCRRVGEDRLHYTQISKEHEPVGIFKLLIDALHDPLDTISYIKRIKPEKVIVCNDGYAEILQKHIPDLVFEQAKGIDEAFGACDFRFASITKPAAKS